MNYLKSEAQMRKYISLALFVVLSAFQCHAQQSAQSKSCFDTAESQMELNRCASDEAKSTDAELNAVYQKLLLVAANEPGAIAKIKVAEKAWIAYRDAYMAAMYPADDKDKQFKYGSSFTMDFDLLYARLTQNQIAALKDMLDQY